MAQNLCLQQQRAVAGRQCGASRPAVKLPAACRRLPVARVQATAAPEAEAPAKQKLQRPDAAGRYGQFGGKYVPETLIPALAELEVAYQEAMADPAFQVG
jgi:tryptophan synthase beta chain